jgi:hypothetical protein
MSSGGLPLRCSTRMAALWSGTKEPRKGRPGDGLPDVALLEVTDPGWRLPRTRPPRLAETGTRTHEATVIGFPDSDARPDGLRVPEQPRGVLEPGGALRRGQLPFDVDTSVPDAAALWKGMSGAAVLDRNDRIIGVVKAAAPDRQHRRLLVSPVAAASVGGRFTECLRELRADPIIEVSEAPRWRQHLAALGANGAPPLCAAADLEALGVKDSRPLPAADAGAPVPYVRRDVDVTLDAALTSALRAADEGRRDGRIVLVFGDSGGGKSRAAAEALRRHEVLRDREFSSLT